MTAVRLPPVLRQYAGDAKQVEASGATLAEVVDQLVTRHPGLRDQLLTSDGDLHRFVNVYLNGQDVRYMAGLETPVGERDTLIVLPAMAGGQAEAQGAAQRRIEP
jgi:molybdopterin converting factor small subunit